MKKRRRKTRRHTNSKKIHYKGETLKSGLELTMYKLLEINEIPFSYEGQKFVIIEGFKFDNVSYEKFLNGKGEFKDRGNKQIADMVYTPDFTPPLTEKLKWVIETKGRTMPDFSRTWKLFKKIIVEEELDTMLFMPRTKRDCLEVIKILKENFYD